MGNPGVSVRHENELKDQYKQRLLLTTNQSETRGGAVGGVLLTSGGPGASVRREGAEK